MSVSLIAPLGEARMARAEESPEALIAQGVELRRQGNDAQAEGYIRRAYELAHTPRSAAQLALVELALSDHWHAEKHFAEALSTTDAWIKAQRSTLEGARVTARKHLGFLRLEGLPPGGTVAVSLPEWPSPEVTLVDSEGRYWLPEGKVSVRAAAAGFKPETKAFTVAAGLPVSWHVEMTPEVKTVAVETPPPAPASGGDPGQPWRYTGLAVAGVGIGATVAGVVLHSLASAKLDHIKAAADKGEAYDPADDSWKTQDRVGTGLIIGGLVAAAGGTVLYVVNRSTGNADQEPPKTSVGMTFGNEGTRTIFLRGSF